MSDTKHPAEVLAKDLSEEWLGGVDGDIRDIAVDMLRRIPALEAVADELAALRASDLAAYKAQAMEIARLRAALDDAQAEAALAREPLTDEQINQITAEQWGRGLGAPYAAYCAYARAIEREVRKQYE